MSGITRMSFSYPIELRRIVEDCAKRESRFKSQMVQLFIKEGLERRGYRVQKYNMYPDTSITKITLKPQEKKNVRFKKSKSVRRKVTTDK